MQEQTLERRGLACKTRKSRRDSNVLNIHSGHSRAEQRMQQRASLWAAVSRLQAGGGESFRAGHFFRPDNLVKFLLRQVAELERRLAKTRPLVMGPMSDLSSLVVTDFGAEGCHQHE